MIPFPPHDSVLITRLDYTCCQDRRMDAGATTPLSVGALKRPYCRLVFMHDGRTHPVQRGDRACARMHRRRGRWRSLVGYLTQGIVAAKTGMAKAAIEMIADTANLIRRILRVRFPVQS